MKIFVVGDLILDDTRIMRKPVRICPEAPVPILVEQERYTTFGGAGLVVDQLTELLGGYESIDSLLPERSRKERIFSDGHLVARVDHDYTDEQKWTTEQLDNIRLRILDSDAVVISDYSKGAISADLARYIMDRALDADKKIFVDAKRSWGQYQGAFAFFPNQDEKKLVQSYANYGAQNVIWKMGSEGCIVNNIPVKPTTNRKVVDVTGAGDIFMAAFVAYYMTGREEKWYNKDRFIRAAEFANAVAGLSVEHVGTHVVKRAELNGLTFSLRCGRLNYGE